MVDTFRLMNQIRIDKYKEMSFEDLAEEFVKTNNQSIIAEVFCRNFKLLSSVAYEPKYQYIDKDDKVDAVVQGVYKSLRKYNKDVGCIFNTFLVASVRRRLASCILYLTQKRHQGISYSLDAMRENTDNEDYDVNIIKNNDTAIDDVGLNYDLAHANLTERELFLCKIIMEDPNISNCELAEMLKCHRHTIAKEKQALKLKLAFML